MGSVTPRRRTFRGGNVGVAGDGLFPPPTSDEIVSHCSRAVWNDPNHQEEIGCNKGPLYGKILAGLRRRTKVGTLLDFGCGFRDFMMLARDAGWSPRGFDPNEEAANIVIARGMEVRCKWKIAEGGFPEANLMPSLRSTVFALSQTRIRRCRRFTACFDRPACWPCG